MTPASRAYIQPTLTVRGREFAWGSRTFVMGILNTTTDSFSGDGVGTDLDAAVGRARQMETEGADWIDIGGESSRPGAAELDPAEEARRVIPAIEAVRATTALPISVDTYHANVARAALRAGADGVNDIWGLRFDPAMAKVVAESGAVLVAMHNQRGRAFGSVAGDIRRGFAETLALCARHGIGADRVIFDPGFGFGWTPQQNLEMLRRLPEFSDLGYPLLVGTSRKSTIGHILGDVPVEQRVHGTSATVALAIAGGADIVRVHDVAAMRDVARVADATIGRGPFAPPQTQIVVALGSNLGDRLANLSAAVGLLPEHGIGITAKSSVWETAPVPADQPAFLNAVVTAETGLDPLPVLRALKRIERALGRRPERRWGPRPIDLDLLFYGDERVSLPELTVPHERILERNFVLAPLAEVVPGTLPVLGGTAVGALAKVGSEGLRRTGALG